MSANRVTTLAEAIAAYVKPGMTVALEGFGHLVPTAAAHEIIRQRIGELTVCRMSCDMMIDQLIAASCVRGLVSSFIGNSSGGRCTSCGGPWRGAAAGCWRSMSTVTAG